MSSKSIYEAPVIQRFEICVDRGFAASPELTIPGGEDDGWLEAEGNE